MSRLEPVRANARARASQDAAAVAMGMRKTAATIAAVHSAAGVAPPLTGGPMDDPVQRALVANGVASGAAVPAGVWMTDPSQAS